MGLPMPSYRARPAKPTPNPEALHEFSSTHVQVTGRPVEILRKMQKAIQPSDIGAEGLETDPHITARYGLHFQTPSVRLRQALKAFGPVHAVLGQTSLFENDDADVRKVNVDSPDLHRLNRLISRLMPVKDGHPRYIPHLTVAYLKPGKGAKYEKDKALSGTELTFHSVVFSGKRGHKETLPLGAAAPGPYRVR